MLQSYETIVQSRSNSFGPHFLYESNKPVVLDHKDGNRTLYFVCLFVVAFFFSAGVKDIVLWINRSVVY